MGHWAVYSFYCWGCGCHFYGEDFFFFFFFFKQKQTNFGLEKSCPIQTACSLVHVAGVQATSWLPPLFNPHLPYEFMHHPVVYRFPATEYAFDPDFIREFTGLKVRWQWDCKPGRDVVGYGYFDVVPSRRFKCKEHARLRSEGAKKYVPDRPIVDDEYVQWENILDSVTTVPQGGEFTYVELGARWGTWVSRAATVFRALRPDVRFRGIAVEADAVYVGYAKEVVAANDLGDRVLVHHGYATAQVMAQLLQNVERVDFVDMDIQGAEKDLFEDAGFWKLAQQKIAKFGVGTHGTDMHALLLKKLKDGDWKILSENGFGTTEKCDQMVSVDKYTEMVTSGCTVQSRRGPIYERDGEITAVNQNLK